MKTNMKRAFIGAVAALSCLTAVPAFAATSQEEYKVESVQIREECKEVKAEIDALRQADEAISEQYKAMQSSIKEGKALPDNLTKDEWKQLTSLRQQVNAEKTKGNSENRESSKPAEGEKKNSAVKTAVQNNDYDAALESLNSRLTESKATLESMKAKHEIWQQIANLMK